jgi:uncharacterized protein
MTRRIGAFSLTVMASAAAAGCQSGEASGKAGATARPAYDVADTAKWRTTREESLKAPDGWLSVAGLLFLEPGVSTIGTDPKNQIVLPAGSAPVRAGRVRLGDDKRIFVTLAPGVDAKINGQPVTGEVELRPESVAPNDKRPEDRLALGRLIIHRHYSGDRLALRVRDPESPILRQFVGLRWWDIDPKWQIEGRFLPFDQPRKLQVPNVLGDLEDAESPGEVELTIDGQTVRLLPLQAARGRLWFVFADAMAAAGETYRIRFVYADAPKDGRVVIDFNRAYNPPCAYNSYTTCPLPPAQNKLTARIAAGERAYAGPHPTPDSTAQSPE